MRVCSRIFTELMIMAGRTKPCTEMVRFGLAADAIATGYAAIVRRDSL